MHFSNSVMTRWWFLFVSLCVFPGRSSREICRGEMCGWRPSDMALRRSHCVGALFPPAKIFPGVGTVLWGSQPFQPPKLVWETLPSETHYVGCRYFVSCLRADANLVPSASWRHQTSGKVDRNVQHATSLEVLVPRVKSNYFIFQHRWSLANLSFCISPFIDDRFEIWISLNPQFFDITFLFWVSICSRCFDATLFLPFYMSAQTTQTNLN